MRFRARKKVHWVSGGTTTLNTQISGSSAQTVTMLTQAGLDQRADDRCVVERIVGDVVISNLDTTDQAGVDIYLGIAHVMEVSDDTVPAVDASADGAIAYGYWLYRRLFRLASIGTTTKFPQSVTTNQFMLPSGSFFDIRVKRKLRRGQSLVMHIKSLNGGGASTVDIRHNWRMLVST